jgi:hypothetical protein
MKDGILRFRQLVGLGQGLADNRCFDSSSSLGSVFDRFLDIGVEWPRGGLWDSRLRGLWICSGLIRDYLTLAGCHKNRHLLLHSTSVASSKI